MSNLQQRFDRLKEQVLVRRPFLREIIQKRGAKNLFDYAKEYIEVNLNPPIQFRQDEFLTAFRSEVAKRLGDEVADSGVEQLKKHYYVSTVDHHGPLCHPFFINGNLLTTTPYFGLSDPALKNVIVFACSNVSLNNSSFPRGLLFNALNPKTNEVVNHKLSFFPAKDRLAPVFNFRAYSKADIEKVKDLVKEKMNNGEVETKEGNKIMEILEQIYLNPQALASDDFSEQITKTNYYLWKEFFKVSEVIPPDLIYMDIESLVLRLLSDYHLDGDTTITHMLFDHDYDSIVMEHFNNIQGAFSTDEKWGTYLFWALPPGAKYRVQLWKDGDYLKTDDGTYSVKLTPEALREAFEKRELIPATMLAYIVLCFYYGVKCLGGFSQVNYLTNMKNAYIKMQVDRGNYRSVEVCARAQTKEMGGDFTLAFLEGAHKELIPATGLDLMLYGDKNTWPTLVEQSKLITLEQGIYPLLPEFYRILYSEPDRDPDLMSVTAEEIAELIGLNKKIKACCSISCPVVS